MVKIMKIRSIFENFIPYEWEISSQEVAKMANIPVEKVLRLDTNTSPFVPKKWLNKIAEMLPNLQVNQYPDTRYTELLDKICKYANVKEDCVVITNGADEGIDIVSKTFIDYGDKVIISVPTYSMLKISSQLAGAKVIEVPRKKPSFEDDVENIIQVCNREKANVIFLCNPNNPTGNFTEIERIKSIVEETDSWVIVDEAYYEYCGKSTVNLISKYPNIVIIRTLSKAFSLAGARVGYLLANEETVKKLNLVRPPNSLTVISIKLGSIALSDIQQMREWVKEIIKEREGCYNILNSIKKIEAYPSETNFILFRVKGVDANVVHKKLFSKGICVRNLSDVKGLENCLRVTIGTREQNERFLHELNYIIEKDAKSR
ncbi:MAG: histidinol-phosphate transaminase [Nitrososphaeria archaeon]|nr:histidinol-phosphate transaminase [Nitrososphaeria archaeon]